MVNINPEIRAYIRANPHYNDDIVADKFNISVRSVSANRSHITMGTDTDNPQLRVHPVHRVTIKGLSLIKTDSYELRINELGQFSRLDLKLKSITKLTDQEAKAIMITKLLSI